MASMSQKGGAPRGVKGRAPGQDSGAKRLKLKTFCHWDTRMMGKICNLFCILQRAQ